MTATHHLRTLLSDYTKVLASCDFAEPHRLRITDFNLARGSVQRDIAELEDAKSLIERCLTVLDELEARIDATETLKVEAGE